MSSEGNEYDDNEGEESEEDNNEYVHDDFIDDNEYDDEESSQEKKEKKKKKQKQKPEGPEGPPRIKHEEEFDEDDLELIKENTDTKKGRKRLLKAKYKKHAEHDEEDKKHEFEDEMADVVDDGRDEFIENNKYDRGKGLIFGATTEQLDQFNQIFEPSDDEDADMEEGKENKVENIHAEMAKLENLDLMNEEEFKNEIIKADIPERLYIRLKDRLDPSEDELEEEAKWIYDAKRHWKSYHSDKDRIISSILNVLKHFRKDKFDIPFISTYRSYIFQQELQPSDFYEIYEMDLEWNNFLKTRKAIREKLNEIRPYISNMEMIDESLILASNNNDLHDIQQYISFYKNILPQFKTDKLKLRDVKKKSYIKMVEAKIDKFVKEATLKPADFAKNLRSNTHVVKMKRMPISPSQMAEAYQSNTYNSVLEVLISVWAFAADELSVHPVIRKCIIDRYLRGLKISTSPTEKGEKEFDVFHPSYRAKRLNIVPLEKFQDDLWFDIQNCKEKGFIEVTFEDEDVEKEIIEWMKSLYYEPYQGDRHEKDWKTFYDEIIERVVQTVLKSDLRKRAIQELKEKSWEYILSKIKDTFWKNFLMVPPYLFQKKACSVVGLVISTSGGPYTLTAVSVSENGEMRAQQVFNYIWIPYADKNQTENYEADISKLRLFIQESKAGLVVIGANCPEARMLKNMMKEKVTSDEITVTKIGHEPWISYGSMEVPQIAANSPSYLQNMKSWTVQVRQALSLARFKQSPISETLKLWNEAEKDNMLIFSLNLHPFQKSIPKSKLIESLRNVAVSWVNAIGIDLHLTAWNTNLHSCVQFISGLGEVKAPEFIKKYLLSNNIGSFRVENTILPPHVHYNAVGFMNVVKANKSLKGSNKNAKVLDGTRIHPEFYSVATKMAKSALDDNQDGSDAVAAILRDPSKLRQLDLEQFSQKWEMMFGKDYKTIFYFIRDELESPFRDIRGDYPEYESKMINQEANVFYMLTGESSLTFFDGLLVPVSINKIIGTDGFSCKSIGKSSWSGFIPRDNVDEGLEKSLSPGNIVTAKISKIEYENLSVKLSVLRNPLTEKEALDRIYSQYRPHFKVDLSVDLIIRGVIQSSDRFGPKNKYKRKIINGWNKFFNISVGQVSSIMKDMRDGDYILRPSPKGDEWLNLSLKYLNGMIIHIEVKEMREGDKVYYWISDDKFESLPELEVRFIKELNKRIQEVAKWNKYFASKDLESFETHLRQLRKKNPSIIPYAFTFLPDFPQHALLGYIPGNDISKVIIEYLKVKHKGYFFHDILHAKLDLLLIYFKNNFQSSAYRKFVMSDKNRIPKSRFVAEEDIAPPEPERNEVSDWTKEPEETPYPAKTTYVGECSQSQWNMSSHPTTNAKFSVHESGGDSGWGTKAETGFKRERPVKQEPSGWGNDNDNNNNNNNNDGDDWNSRRERNNDSQGFSQNSSRGFRGRGRGRGGRGRDGDRRDDGDRRGGGGGGGGDRNCFNCGQPGHFSRECPEKSNGGGFRGRRGGRGGRDGDRRDGGRDGGREGRSDEYGGGFKRRRMDDGDDFGAKNSGKDGGSEWGGAKQESQWGGGGGSSWGGQDKKESEWGGNKKGSELGGNKKESEWGGGHEEKKESEWGGAKKSSEWGGTKKSSEWGGTDKKEEASESGW